MNTVRSFQLLSLALVAICASTLAPLQSHAGTMISGGVLPMYNLPKLVGDAPVSYCVKQTARFSLSGEKAAQVVREVLEDWSKTLIAMGDDAPSIKRNGVKISVATSFVEVSCSLSTQLVFELGTKSRASSFVESSENEPVVVWIAPDLGAGSFKHFASFATEAQTGQPIWTDDARLFNVLLHEVGHVLGFGHDYDTFMSVTVLKEQVDLKIPASRATSASLR